MQIYLIFALVIAAVAVLFTLQNTASVAVSFLFWKFDSSLAFVLVAALAAGALISMLLSLPSLIKHKWNITSQRKKIGTLETNLTDYRSRLEEAQKKLAELQNPPAAPSNPAAPAVPDPAAPVIEQLPPRDPYRI